MNCSRIIKGQGLSDDYQCWGESIPGDHLCAQHRAYSESADPAFEVTRESIEHLKYEWKLDPDSFEIEDVPGFESVRDELIAFREEELERRAEQRLRDEWLGHLANDGIIRLPLEWGSHYFRPSQIVSAILFQGERPTGDGKRVYYGSINFVGGFVFELSRDGRDMMERVLLDLDFATPKYPPAK
jgi:hypothetical protein